MQVSQFFVLSERGDHLVSKDYRHDIVSAEEIFFREVATNPSHSPCFTQNGIVFLFIKRGGLYFTLATRYNISPTYGIELIERIFTIVKDFVGEVTEERVRRNVCLITELVNEIVDYGYLQMNDALALKISIRTQAVSDSSSTQSSRSKRRRPFPGLRLPSFALGSKETVPSDRAHQSLLDVSNSNNIYIDILEYMNFIFNTKGETLLGQVVGKVVIKSYLNGTPRLTIGFSEPLPSQDIHFSELVTLDPRTNSLSLYPPIGEHVVLGYRLTRYFSYPFRMFPYVEQQDFKVELILKIRCLLTKDFHATKTLVKIPVPKNAVSVVVEFGVHSSQSYEYKQDRKYVLWGISRFDGETEQLIRVKVALDTSGPKTVDGPAAVVASAAGTAVKRGFSPIGMKFEIPMFSCSSLKIRSLNFDTEMTPEKWVRYITRAKNYSLRL